MTVWCISQVENGIKDVQEVKSVVLFSEFIVVFKSACLAYVIHAFEPQRLQQLSDRVWGLMVW